MKTDELIDLLFHRLNSTVKSTRELKYSVDGIVLFEKRLSASSAQNIDWFMRLSVYTVELIVWDELIA